MKGTVHVENGIVHVHEVNWRRLYMKSTSVWKGFYMEGTVHKTNTDHFGHLKPPELHSKAKTQAHMTFYWLKIIKCSWLENYSRKLCDHEFLICLTNWLLRGWPLASGDSSALQEEPKPPRTLLQGQNPSTHNFLLDENNKRQLVWKLLSKVMESWISVYFKVLIVAWNN